MCVASSCRVWVIFFTRVLTYLILLKLYFIYPFLFLIAIVNYAPDFLNQNLIYWHKFQRKERPSLIILA